MPLLEAPRRLRYAAVDLLPEMVAGLALQVEEMVESMQRRCETAARLLLDLEAIAGPASDGEVGPAASSATSHRRQTQPASTP
jgi:hypothetical protein